jgi:CheY-like chemotaxis protein
VRQDADGRWVFLPGIEAQLKRLNEQQELLGVEILWVDDNPKNNAEEIRELTLAGATVTAVESTQHAISILASRAFDVIISDMLRDDETAAGLDLLRGVQAIGLDVPVIIYSSSYSAEGANAAIGAGAFHWANSPTKLQRLVVQAVHRTLAVDRPLSPLDIARARILALLVGKANSRKEVRYAEASTIVGEAVAAEQSEVAHYVLVAGSGQFELALEVRLPAELLGERLAREGYGLISGGWPGVDHIVARAFTETLRSLGKEPSSRFMQVIETGRRNDFEVEGAKVEVRDDWSIGSVSQADMVVLIDRKSVV